MELHEEYKKRLLDSIPVVKGMDVVRKIQQQPSENQMLVKPVKILFIQRSK